LFLYDFLIYNLQKGGVFLDPCAVNMSVSALACAIAKGKTSAEISALSAFFYSARRFSWYNCFFWWAEWKLLW